ncbi:DUF6174 domain-containing protein [Catenovulum sp. SX2]|uniref:DUF6174 domain-containing protein n=1 Tax=Catenovulum sp. SX2 TaxID=3398614 RepID=UPI003F824972
MFSSNNYISILFATIISVAFVWVFTSLQFMRATHTIEELDANIAKWNNNEPRNYSYKIVKGCMFLHSINVTNIGGNLSYSGNEGGANPANIAALFKELRKAINSAHSLQIEYSSMGYPKSYSVDWSNSVVDDECFATVELLADIRE